MVSFRATPAGSGRADSAMLREAVCLSSSGAKWDRSVVCRVPQTNCQKASVTTHSALVRVQISSRGPSPAASVDKVAPTGNPKHVRDVARRGSQGPRSVAQHKNTYTAAISGLP